MCYVLYVVNVAPWLHLMFYNDSPCVHPWPWGFSLKPAGIDLSSYGLCLKAEKLKADPFDGLNRLTEVQTPCVSACRHLMRQWGRSVYHWNHRATPHPITHLFLTSDNLTVFIFITDCTETDCKQCHRIIELSHNDRIKNNSMVDFSLLSWIKDLS